MCPAFPARIDSRGVFICNKEATLSVPWDVSPYCGTYPIDRAASTLSNCHYGVPPEFAFAWFSLMISRVYYKRAKYLFSNVDYR